MKELSLSGSLRIVVCGAVLLAATFIPLATKEPTEVDVIFAHSAEVYPAETLRDWVSYASQVAVVEVVGERPMPAEVNAGVAHIGRTVEIEVQETLWTDGLPQPSSIEMVADGWLMQGDTEVEIWPAHGLRLVNGQRYVVPLVNSGGEWGILSESSVIPLADGEVHPEFAAQTEATAQVRGVDALRFDLAATEADPLVAAMRTLDPTQRALAVVTGGSR